MSEKDTPPGSNGLFDQEQYDWLLRCVHLAIVEKRQKRLVPGETHDIPEIKLAGANLAKLNLRDIQLQLANLEGATIRNATLFGTKCCLASVDGRTVITDCEINDKTDFTGVELSGWRIDPKLRTQLLRNIRKIQWEK